MSSNVSTDRGKRVAVFPGTFDPFTKGHTSMIEKIMKLDLFDEVHILIASNPNKSASMFSTDVRADIIEASLRDGVYGYTVEHGEKIIVGILPPECTTMWYCAQVGANVIIRGLRDSSDLSYEQKLEIINDQIDSRVKTLYVMSDPRLAYISSTLVREALRYNSVYYGK